MPHRYFTTEISDGTATLRGADAHHLARVMRARLGDTVILCDGNAVEYTATITGFGDECVEFRVEPGYPSAAEPSVEVTLLDTTNTEAVRAAIRPNTKLIHVETPGNPTTGISDLDAIAEIAHKAGALLSVDATFAGPICIRPLSHGADLEIHSMTKYINGHGDSLGGCVLGRAEMIDKIKELAMVNYGGILSPFNAWLVTRGLTTIPLRMKQHSAVALAVAEFLETCPATRFVWYPGLKSHPQHELAEKLMHGQYSGMMSFDLKGDERQHQKFLDSLHLVTHAVSLGDVESLIVYYDKNSDKLPHYPPIYREGFFRFSIGLEDAEDVIADLKQAMEAAEML